MHELTERELLQRIQQAQIDEEWHEVDALEAELARHVSLADQPPQPEACEYCVNGVVTTARGDSELACGVCNGTGRVLG